MKLNVYFVPFMVRLPLLLALLLIVYDDPVETSCTFAVTVDVLFATDWLSTVHAICILYPVLMACCIVPDVAIVSAPFRRSETPITFRFS